MTHYAEALGGEVAYIMKNADAASPEDRMPGGDDLVMNMAIKVGDMMMFGSDNSTDMYETPQGFRLQLEAGSRKEFDRLYDMLAKNARAEDIPVGETFWAERFAMFTDRFGTPWMVNFTGSKA